MSDVPDVSIKDIKLKTRSVNLYYGSFHALGDITFDIPACAITAIIGPSGCGKSTLLRLFNRMNDLIPGVTISGETLLNDVPIYGKEMDVVSLRQKIGMVFQKPNVFPMSIYENIVIGPKHHGTKNKRELMEITERSLSQVALWDEVKDDLNKPGLGLAMGQQQRLCIARALAVEPEVLLMDESCSALDPESTMKIEDLMQELAEKYTIVIVTHNMEQAARVSHMSAFMMIDENQVGRLHEYSETQQMFISPKDKLTEDYITGRFG
ncbi:MAG: phosphate ABC transporter ATP-binding protein PstB [Oscillospiraceae bacterium]|jgi:phosphate transport system ATP-binding protein|nr:phosphate ABC transporter ATP-binding protein PstB [Oscillospiraceae bacterium]